MASLCLQQISDALDKKKIGFACKLLRALDDCALVQVQGRDSMATVQQSSRLFLFLRDASILGLDDRLDQIIIKILLHALEQYDDISKRRVHKIQDGIIWLTPPEMDLKGHLEVYRNFSIHITQTCTPSTLTDLNFLKAKHRLQKLCPRINNLASWSHVPPKTRDSESSTPIPKVRVPSAGVRKQKKERRSHKRATITKRQLEIAVAHGARQMPPTPPTEEGSGSGSHPRKVLPGGPCINPTHEAITIPTPDSTVASKHRQAATKKVDGWIEEPTQPFDADMMLSRVESRGLMEKRKRRSDAYGVSRTGRNKPVISSGHGLLTWPRCVACQRKVVFDGDSEQLLSCSMCEGLAWF
ncbi:hypothetical protein B0T22DRAFT_458163 [Podospora appendiculata]|uniref:Uncharacterized protein n=1 Tax=Podospora appendiculata TaxID=314037 RepID=A0AAE0X8L1_9PEZI|nr:hypothetical protein B0T22DRAFT_458163 [Podospora appendiculata]